MEVADDAGGGSASSPVVVAPPQAPPAGDPMQPAVGEACGRAIKNTSGVWKYVRDLSPAEVKEDGMNVRCVVKKKWPRSGLAPERVTTCGHLMKYVRANKAMKIKSGGTSGLLAHLESKHPAKHKAAVKDSRHTSEGKAKRAMVASGKGVMGRLEYDTACRCEAIVGCVCLSRPEL